MFQYVAFYIKSFAWNRHSYIKSILFEYSNGIQIFYREVSPVSPADTERRSTTERTTR